VTIDAEAAAAAPLAALHTALTNMEAGCATLREAAELSGAFRRVEEVFAAGDLPRVADMLRSMARRWVFTYFSCTLRMYSLLIYVGYSLIHIFIYLKLSSCYYRLLIYLFIYTLSI
jgi:hypothetical protein